MIKCRESASGSILRMICKFWLFIVIEKRPRILEEISISGGVLMELYHELLLFLEVSSLS